MAILCSEHDLLFIMAPRTACTAVGQVLRERLGGAPVPQTDILNSEGLYVVQKKHSTMPELISHGVITAREQDQLLSFSCVRNPFDSMVSLYIKKRVQYQPLLADPDSWVYRLPHYADDMRFCATHSFTSWITRTCLGSMVKRAFLGKKPSLYGRFTDGVKVVMHFESLQQDFQAVLKQAGINQRVDIPSVNLTTARRANYLDYYSPLARSVVAFAFATDLQRYGYSFKGTLP